VCAELQEQYELPSVKALPVTAALSLQSVPFPSAQCSSVAATASSHPTSPFSPCSPHALPVGCSSSVPVSESFLSKVHFFLHSLMCISNVIFPSESLSLVSPLCNVGQQVSHGRGHGWVCTVLFLLRRHKRMKSALALRYRSINWV